MNVISKMLFLQNHCLYDFEDLRMRVLHVREKAVVHVEVVDKVSVAEGLAKLPGATPTDRSTTG